MRLPVTLVFEPPTRADLRRPGFWALVVALGLLIGGAILLMVARRVPREVTGSALLTIASTPSGATILIDGHARGHTPATLALPPGSRRVTLRLARHEDVSYTVALAPDRPATLDGLLWPLAPQLQHLHSPLPGAAITDARFLADGRLALTVALPSRDERQLWLLDRGGDARRVGPAAARIAIAPSADGARVAYLAPAPGTSAPTATGAERAVEVWLAGLDGASGERRYALPANTADERLVDLSWSPDGARLLLVSQQRPQGGSARTRLLRLDIATGTARELIALPGDIVPGAYAWSPRGDRVAVLARAAGRTTLCLVGMDGQLFRALADVGGTPPFPPLAWAPGGDRLVYAAPGDTPSHALIGAPPPQALVVDDLAGDPGRRLGAALGQGPGWRDDGLILALARPKAGGPVVLRAFDATGAGQELGALPLPPGAIAGARWDLAHGQALVALRGTADADAADLWLVRWTARDEGAGR